MAIQLGYEAAEQPSRQARDEEEPGMIQIH